MILKVKIDKRTYKTKGEHQMDAIYNLLRRLNKRYVDTNFRIVEVIREDEKTVATA